MTAKEIEEKIREFSSKRVQLALSLVTPAKAAATQMRDAGMTLGADSLMSILFHIDALDSEVRSIIESDPLESIDALISIMEGVNK